ncbi:hypothetical protein AB205_0201590, partial [Aquarana catesbeiana]
TRGFVAKAEPYSGCSEITNSENIKGRIALMHRGQCMFAEKARNVQKSGAIGGIVIDDNDGSSSDTAPLFQMAGDGKNTDDITIAMLFLFSKEGNIILDAIREYQEVEVLLSDKAKDRDSTWASVYKFKNLHAFEWKMQCLTGMPVSMNHYIYVKGTPTKTL